MKFLFKGLFCFLLATIFTCVSLKAQSPKVLVLSFYDGTMMELSLPTDVILTPFNDNMLLIENENMTMDIFLDNIKKFSIDYPTAGVDEITEGNQINAEWKIWSLDGLLINSGLGGPKFEGLVPGQTYIVAHGKLTYKYLKR